MKHCTGKSTGPSVGNCTIGPTRPTEEERGATVRKQRKAEKKKSLEGGKESKKDSQGKAMDKRNEARGEKERGKRGENNRRKKEGKA